MIPSPPMKIEIIGRKIVDNAQQCFALFSQVNFPTNNLNFHWRWWDRIKAIVLNLFYFNKVDHCVMSLLSCWTSNIGRRKCATINQMGLKWQCIEKSKCFCWKDHESLHLYWLGSFLLPNLWRAGVNQTSFGVKWCQLYFEVS